MFRNEWVKLLHTKRMLLFAVLPLLLAALCLGVNSMLSAQLSGSLETNYRSLAAQYTDNIEFYETELEVYKDNVSTQNRLQKLIASHTAKAAICQAIADAVHKNDRRAYLQACIDQQTQVLQDISSGLSVTANRAELQQELAFVEYLQAYSMLPLFSFCEINVTNTLVTFLDSLYPLLFPLLFLIFSASFADEFHFGTIKLLLQTPCRRRKICLCKYGTALLLSLAVTVLTALVLALSALMIGGFGDPAYPIAGNGELIIGTQAYIAAGDYLWQAGLLCLAQLVGFSALGLLLSFLIHNQALCTLLFAGLSILPAAFSLPFWSITASVGAASLPIIIGLSLAAAALAATCILLSRLNLLGKGGGT